MSILRRLYESSSRSVALFVDGPNILREKFDVDLDDVRAAADQFGRPAVRRLYLDEHAPSGLIQAAEARGFEIITTSSDVDVRLSVDLTKVAVTNSSDIIAIVSRDADFKPAIEVANSHDQQTVVISPGVDGRSDALRNAATTQITLGEHDVEVDASIYNQSEDTYDAEETTMTRQEAQNDNRHIESDDNTGAHGDSDTGSETTEDAPAFVGYDN
ncbi:MAG: hypothetical protein J07HQW2_01523 [Haloquadratum walsbyi J07HQW2]|uniref:NYN domain-containing protein n=1 Tax=Haloquadratum walsbyi J07HQW2 TaxID=1238425 RepID=U1NE97_9EURY|nr:MAG: hypothetical protein J07HQW2_01523 [Haloquadratum walsbyi J07HQW2]